MYNGKEENKQRMLDFMLGAIQEMGANGTEQGNPIIGLKLFTREKAESTWCRSFPAGDYVRIIFKDSPDRDDGYYDVYVSGDNCKGMFEDVWNRVKECIG